MKSLARNEIRLQYSGFIISISKLLSVATGLARGVSDAEFGI